MKAGKQTTLRNRTAVSGIGVHSGLPVTLTLHPADAGTGVVFIRCVGGKRQPALQMTDSFIPQVLRLAGLNWKVP